MTKNETPSILAWLLVAVIQVALICLQLTGTITLSWWIIFLPTILSVIVIVAYVFIILIIGYMIMAAIAAAFLDALWRR